MAIRLRIFYLNIRLILIWFYSAEAAPECSISGDPRGTPRDMNTPAGSYFNIFTTMILRRSDWVTKFDYYASNDGNTYISFWENIAGEPEKFKLKGKILFYAQSGYHMYTVPYKDQIFVSAGSMIGVHYPDKGTLFYERPYSHRSSDISWENLEKNRNGQEKDTYGNWSNGHIVMSTESENRSVALRVFFGCECNENVCRRPCPKNCKNAICNETTALCEMGCKSGFQGIYCTENCSSGFFGENCIHKCSMNCYNKSDNICDRITGNCPPGGCDIGYQGERCESCESGSYGLNCYNICGNCLNDDACNVESGYCPRLCKPGYEAPLCSDKCKENKYGKNCSFNCNCRNDELCDHVTGRCENGCTSGYKDEACTETKAEESRGQEKSSNGALIGGIVTAVLVITAVLTIVVFAVRRWKHCILKKEHHGQSHDYVNENSTSIITKPVVNESTLGASRGTVLQKSTRNQEYSLNRSNSDESHFSSCKEKKEHCVEADVTKDVYENVSQTKRLSHPIDVISFSKYVASAKATDCKDLQEEFSMLPEGQTAPWTVAINGDLVLKNKFKNILPYDRNRVILHKTGNDDLSHYINASFVDGYESEKKFIASHGPRDPTKIDFWRMIWQYNVSVIVMVTNLVEDSKIKCIKYWPTDCINTYGDISVTSLQEEEWQDYVVRKFIIKKNKEERPVTQFHYIGWPDHGVPVHASGLLTMVHRTKSHLVRHDKAPVVVHCSAGVGRTGTFIALDWLLEQIQQEKKVDVLGCVAKLRTFRINMVQTSAQYIFIYDAMNETLLLGQTSIHCSEINTVYENLRESERREDKLRTQFHFLEDTNPKFTDDEFVTAMSAGNNDHNRDMTVLPADKNRVVLLDGISLQECYINAVMIQGYRKEILYYATQLPLPNTIPRFWCMIWRYKIPAIVVLETDSSCKWYPEKGEALFQGEYEIQTVETTETTGFYAYTIEISQRTAASEYYNMVSEQGHKRITLLLALKREVADIYGSEIINLHRELLELLRKVEQSSVAVLCRNGAHLSGLYIACCILFDMVIAEQEFDVFQVVQKIRHIRPQFVASLEQYKQLYEIVKEFAAGE